MVSVFSRRTFVSMTAGLGAAMLLRSGLPRAWSSETPDRPNVHSSVARIARPDERGVPLLILGKVFEQDRRTTAKSVVIYAYHTDAAGLYRDGRVDWPSRPPRLAGAVETDQRGDFQFTTIRPAPYPGGNNPAHVHFVLWWPDGHRQYDTLLFEDDPLLSAELREKQNAHGEFSYVRPVSKHEGTQQVSIRLRRHEEKEQ